MGERVCPWWLGYLLASPLRRLLHNERKILAPYIRPGMTVLEPGPGMGFFTLELARLVGPSGEIIAVDVQPKMIAGLKRRAARAHLLDRIDARLAERDSLGLNGLAGTVDFTLAFAVVHEMPSPGPFFADAAAASKPGARLLFVEPAGHVTEDLFARELQAAAGAGFRVIDRPNIPRTHAVLLQKQSIGARPGP
jgi:SAM-dependent methyltransferase